MFFINSKITNNDVQDQKKQEINVFKCNPPAYARKTEKSSKKSIHSIIICVITAIKKLAITFNVTSK